ncbi:MAG: hypothetical protein QM674_12995 [Burkholderiaceae bacterium]
MAAVLLAPTATGWLNRTSSHGRSSQRPALKNLMRCADLQYIRFAHHDAYPERARAYHLNAADHARFPEVVARAEADFGSVDAMAYLQAECARVLDEIAKWEEVSISTTASA